MMHWKLTLAYDGTSYRGWQVQPGLHTIQGVLADAIQRTVGERVLPQGSGRTDAGVHALGQVASFALAATIPPANLHRALNRCLPPSIRVLAAEVVPPTFHARHSALGKTYEYRIFPLKIGPLTRVPHSSRLHRDEGEEIICPPTLAPYVWPCPWPLDIDALNQAAGHVLGAHDFTTFAAVDPDLTHRTQTAPELGVPHLDSEMWAGPPQKIVIPTEAAHGSIVSGAVEGPPYFAFAPVLRREPGAPHLDSEMWVGPPSELVRTITHSQWHAADGLLLYRVTASGFLHHMVRNLVGTFVQAGAHRLSPDSIPTLLAGRNRAAAGPTAPATGLFLVSVDYPTPPTLSS